MTPRPRTRRTLAASAALAIATAVLIAVPVQASAAPPVFNDSDSGIGSLRFAIDNSVEGDVIVIPATVTSIQLQSPLVLEHSLDIRGPGSGVLTITRDAGSGDFHLLTILPTGPDQDFSVSGIAFLGSATLPVQAGIGILASIGTEPARDLTLDDITVTGQHSAYGAGLNTFLLQGDLLITNSRFDDNVASVGVGGAASIDQSVGDVDIRDSSFSGNVSADEGGAVFIRHSGNPATITVQSVDFSDNSTTVLDAGGLYVSGAREVVISDGTRFAGNASEIDGGGAYFYDIGDLTVTETVFSDNTAKDQGGGMFLVDVVGHVVVSSTSFLRNISQTDGGGIYAIAVNSAAIQASSFEQNHAGVRVPPLVIQGDGAGAYLGTVAGALTVSDTVFVDNTAPQGIGGGLAIGTVAGAVDIERSSFLGNHTFFGGGGVWVGVLDSAAVPALSVDSSTFAGNSSGKIGSAGTSLNVETVYSPVSIVNSTFDERADNPGNVGALAFSGLDAPSATDVLVDVRSTTVAGPGALVVFNVTDGGVSVAGSVLESSVRPAVLTFAAPDGLVAIRYSVVSTPETTAYATGPGVVYSVPDMRLGPLADNGGPTLTRLPLLGSPVWDAGDPSTAGFPTLDQRGPGFPRVLGGRMDAGAVESPRLLPATGQGVDVWVPIGGAILLVLGVGALLFARLHGRGRHRVR